ncbi:Glycerol-3-phosphate 1-O-acyltransferase [Bertholletia excelsa]
MVFPSLLLKLADHLLYQLLANSLYRAATKLRNYGLLLKNPYVKSTQQHPLFPAVTNCSLENRGSQTLVCDIQALLISQSFFPYFMLIAFEGGSIFRAFFLLLSSPILWVLDCELKLRIMVFITFCGLRVKDVESVGRAVLPKFFLENISFKAYKVWDSVKCRVVFTSMPRVMVEGFLREYLSVSHVAGTELQTFGNYFTGLISGSGLLVKHRAVKEFFGEKKPDVGLGSSSLHDHLFISYCKEAYVVGNEDMKGSTASVMPRDKYPKPLVFHDGRLAFFPTPLSTLVMFLWLPLGIPVAIFRLFVGILLPYKLAILLGTLSGVNLRTKNCDSSNSSASPKRHRGRGVLYVCTHRTLLDPVFLSTSLGKPLTAVTYSLSKMSEIMAPIRTVRLTRDRKQDGETMQRLLAEGDLVVCPEGTTCREPYLLRFSSLFAELADEIVPVAVNTEVSMFYGTTASGLKCLDPIFFLMNPSPTITFISLGSFEVANYIQRQLADALGFQCTSFTRRDKYMMLAGNEGVVQEINKRRKH